MKIFNPFSWYKQRAERKKRQAKIAEGVIKGYHELINEYRLIQEKKRKAPFQKVKETLLSYEFAT